MVIQIDDLDRLVIHTGKQREYDPVVLATIWFSLFVIVCYIAKLLQLAPSPAVAIIGLIVLSPLLAVAVFLAIPDKFFSHQIVLDRKEGTVVKTARWLFAERTYRRNFREFSAVMIIEDLGTYGKGGTAPRVGLFFCLGRMVVKRRVLFVDYLTSPTDGDKANDAACQISYYTGWEVEYLKFDRELKDSDVCWEDW